MKRLLPILLLSGCSIINMAVYDPNEYAIVTQIRTQAQFSDCSKANLYALKVNAVQLQNYSQYLPNNAPTIKLNSDLYKLIHELYESQNPSKAYCTAKLELIGDSAQTIQKVIGNKPR